MELHKEILELIRGKMNADDEYINPHFMLSITDSIFRYYEIEDDDIDKWICGMFGA